MFTCGICSKEIKDDEGVLQLRFGYVEGDEFFADHDSDHYHSGCYDSIDFTVLAPPAGEED